MSETQRQTPRNVAQLWADNFFWKNQHYNSIKHGWNVLGRGHNFIKSDSLWQMTSDTLIYLIQCISAWKRSYKQKNKFSIHQLVCTFCLFLVLSGDFLIRLYEIWPCALNNENWDLQVGNANTWWKKKAPLHPFAEKLLFIPSNLWVEDALRSYEGMAMGGGRGEGGRNLSVELKPSTSTLAANQKEILRPHCCQFQFIRGKCH